MTYEEIQKRVNELSAVMLAKGMVAPQAEIHISSEKIPGAYLRWSDKSAQYGSESEWISASTVDEAIARSEAFIASRPSAEQAKMNEFLRALGKVIDIGNEYGIEADYLNPLVASMKKLSENVITFQKDAE